MNSNLKNNLKYLFTTLISIVGVIISATALNISNNQNLYSTFPNLILSSIQNSRRFQLHDAKLYYQIPKNNDIKIKLINIGDGPAKNISYTWDKNNTNALIDIINKIDTDGVTQMRYNNSEMLYEFASTFGSLSITNYHYLYHFDYIMSEKNSSSKSVILFPIEYEIYLEIIFYLSSYYNYDLEKDFRNINFKGTLQYNDVKGKTYKKNIKFIPKIEVKKNDIYHTYNYKIEAQNI